MFLLPYKKNVFFNITTSNQLRNMSLLATLKFFTLIKKKNVQYILSNVLNFATIGNTVKFSTFVSLAIIKNKYIQSFIFSIQFALTFQPKNLYKF